MKVFQHVFKAIVSLCVLAMFVVVVFVGWNVYLGLKSAGAFSQIATTFGTQNSTSTAKLSTAKGTQSTKKVPSVPNRTVSIYQHIENQDTHFSAVTTNPKASLMSALHKDPYLYYNVAEYSWATDGENVSYSLKYRETRAQNLAVKSQSHKVLQQILKPGMTTEQKERAIHDWIVLHVHYDLSYGDATAYDAMFKDTAVCQGYALLTYRMMTEADIQTRLVNGFAGGQGHMWNQVYVSGSWLNVDTTWDDPIGASPNYLSHQYFNVTNTQISKDHTFAQTQVY